jgi:hypothetical protein
MTVVSVLHPEGCVSDKLRRFPAVLLISYLVSPLNIFDPKRFLGLLNINDDSPSDININSERSSIFFDINERFLFLYITFYLGGN